jgi:hypothetical protein
MRSWRKVLVAAALISLVATPGLRVMAQAELPIVTIQKAELVPDVPHVTAELSIIEQKPGASGNFVGGLTSDKFEVFEDDKPVPPGDVVVTEQTAGAAVVIVLDTGANVVNQRGVVGRTRWEDVSAFSDDRTKNGLVSELVDHRLNDNDWIGLVGVTDVITPVVPLGRDRNEVTNHIKLMQPYNRATPLRAGIDQALKLFESPDPASAPPSHLRKAIVVFSDGIDIKESPDEYADLIRRAKEAGVTFYTVGLASPNSKVGFEAVGLARLAKQTDGAFVANDSPEQHAAVLALFDRLVSQRQQYHLDYPTHLGQGQHELRVRVTTPDGPVEARTNLVSKIKMPTLEIAADKTGVMKGDKVTITPQWKVIDGYNRNPAKIEYLISGNVVTTLNTLDPFVWDTSMVPDTPGVEYPLDARAYDSVLADAPPATSNQVKVKVEIPAPTQVVNSVGQNWLGLLLLPVVVLLLIIVIPNRKKISQTARATTQRLQVATRRLTPLAAARYKLMALNLGQEFPLTEKIVRIGRDPNSMIALNDPGISLAHADLIEDQSGTYMIVDLTSTNGTYVNGQRLQLGPMPGQPGPAVLLHSGDIVRVGGVELRFDYAKATRRLP